jgi:SAM-dependent methyltransferase
MNEADEGLGLVDDDDDATSLSIKSPVFDYIYENGRRYHRFHEGAYPLPNDAAEQHRLKLFHHIWYMLMNSKLCKMPLYDPQMVLDVGCGTGDWAIDMGDCYPSAVVIGTDLSPIQPTWIPPNVRFYVDDAEDEWAFDNHNFDLVHGRMLAGSINNWPRFFEQAFANLRPGGYVEMNELELSFCSDDASPEDIEPLNQIMARYNKASKMFGKSFDDVSSMKQNMQDAGFVDIQKEVYKVRPYSSFHLAYANFNVRSPLATGPQTPYSKPSAAPPSTQPSNPSNHTFSPWGHAFWANRRATFARSRKP